MGIILLAAFIFACSDLARLAIKWRPGLAPLASRATLGLLLAAVAAAFYGGLRVPGLLEIEVPIKDLPKELEGYRIAQVSDMHIDSEAKLRRFARIADKLNTAGLDLLLVTGDFIDPGLTCSEELSKVTAGLKVRHGIFGVFGNHEYYYGAVKAEACYAAFGIKLLRNAHADAGKLRLIGLGDIHTEHLSEAGISAILEKGKSDGPTLVMSHQPEYFPLFARFGADLVLSGHTHRGQIVPFHVFTRLFYKYFYGRYRLGDTFFYVTSGSGTWGPSMRLLAPSEIPVFTLKRS
jgi:predicted MPP superfamily phosphohydrolase